MADSNPTAVPIRIPERHHRFLRETFQLGQAAARELEADVYGRLLAALRTGSIVPDPDVRRVVEALLDATDDSNEYPRVFAEHVALASLLDQLLRGTA